MITNAKKGDRLFLLTDAGDLRHVTVFQVGFWDTSESGRPHERIYGVRDCNSTDFFQDVEPGDLFTLESLGVLIRNLLEAAAQVRTSH